MRSIYYTYYIEQEVFFLIIVILFLLWILFNGRFTADAGMLQICIVGLVVTAFTCIVAYKTLHISVKTELKYLKKLPILALYAVVLVKEIIISNIKMAGFIFSRKNSTEPVMIQVKIPLKTNFCKVILANSITLTPGTITADFCDDVFTIHCIDASLADGIESCTFVKILERLEK